MIKYRLLVLCFKDDTFQYNEWKAKNFIHCMYTYDDVTQFYKNLGHINYWMPLDDII